MFVISLKRRCLPRHLLPHLLIVRRRIMNQRKRSKDAPPNHPHHQQQQQSVLWVRLQAAGENPPLPPSQMTMSAHKPAVKRLMPFSAPLAWTRINLKLKKNKIIKWNWSCTLCNFFKRGTSPCYIFVGCAAKRATEKHIMAKFFLKFKQQNIVGVAIARN